MSVYYQQWITNKRGERVPLGYPYAVKYGNPFMCWGYGSRITAVRLEPQEAEEILCVWGQPYVNYDEVCHGQED